MDQHEQEGYALEGRVKGIIDALPSTSFLRAYVNYAGCLTDANAVYHLGAGLALLTQIVPDDLQVRLGNRLYGNLYVLLVGVSTDSRKTSAVRIAGEVMEEAIPGRVSGKPGSYEGLYDSLAKQNRQLIPYEEFGHFLAETRNGYLTKVKTGYANIYDGSPLDRKLAQQGSSTKSTKVYPPVQKPRLSLLCAVTPGFLSRYSEPVDWTDGFFARFFTFQAYRCRSYIVTPPEWMEMRGWVVHRLRQLNAVQIGETVCEQPTGEALVLMEEWLKWQSYMAKTKGRSKTAGAIGRSQALVLKVAMLLHLDLELVTAPVWRLDPKLLHIAMCIVRLHLESVLRVGENLGGTTDMNDRQSVLQALSDVPKTIGQLADESFLLRHRTLQILETLREQRLVETSHAQSADGTYDKDEVYTRSLGKLLRMSDYTQPTGPGPQLIEPVVPAPDPTDKPTQ